ncbi:MAG: hypothetical protein M3O50_02455 [Myxococcota bacterium]|nr:hypothetical protein [Myxococcota bacterium]
MEVDRARISAFLRAEEVALSWLALADPRLARRTILTPRDDLAERLAMEAMPDEQVSAPLPGHSLDLFAFPARKRALDRAAQALARFAEPLPSVGPAGSLLARPQLERELLARLIEEEKLRAEDEARLGDSSGELVRAIVSTWTPPVAAAEWPERDAWLNKHLLEIRSSLSVEGPRIAPTDLDVALYPLERLLPPLQFPRASAAIAQLRMAIDEDMRVVPDVAPVERVRLAVQGHLGLRIETATLRPRLERLVARLRVPAARALGQGQSRRDVASRARKLLYAEGPCPAPPGTLVRVVAAPPERAAICGVVSALTTGSTHDAALVALHDDVLMSLAAIAGPPPPRLQLLSEPENDLVDALERSARERPVIALGIALAAEIIYGSDGADSRLQAWRDLGEAPLDIVAREVNTPAASAAVGEAR